MDTDLDQDHFARLAGFIEEHYGIRIPPEKKVMIQARLSKRVRFLQLASIDEYIQLLLDDPRSGDEVSRMTDLVSTHMTAFFREPAHFEILAQRMLPDLCAHFDRTHPLIIWSSACSTGEEPYTLAMVLEKFRMNHRKDLPHFEYAVIGTDLSSGVLEVARNAVYPASSLDVIPEPMRSTYLMRSRSKAAAAVRIVPELRSRVFFRSLNLMEFPYAFHNAVHVIFCRNVLIYFDRTRQEQVLRSLCQVLEPNGFLIVGHAESIVRMDLGVVTYAPTIYRKTLPERVIHVGK
jgi:chemotaxis protein methyltransferase CheR